MSNQTVCLRGEQLASALLTCAKQDIRYYLNGVYVECSPTVTRVSGTNGHILYIEDYETTNTFTGSFIIPRDVIERAKPKSAFWYVDIGERIGETDFNHYKGCTLRDGVSITVGFDCIAGRFPDYTRVMPHFTPRHWTATSYSDPATVCVQDISNPGATYPPKFNMEQGYESQVVEALNQVERPACFNPDYIATAQKVNKLHNGSKVPCLNLYQNGLTAASIIQFTDKAFMVIMPIRDNKEKSTPFIDAFRSRLTVPEIQTEETAQTTE